MITDRETPRKRFEKALARVPGVFFTAFEGLVLASLLALAWRVWSAWPLVPLADPDTWGYLNPALTWLSGLGFVQTDGRDWLYPAMLALFLKTTGTLTGIVAWQKALALAAGGVMGLAWSCWVSMLPFNRWVRLGCSVAGVVPLYTQLVNPQNIVFIWSIRPEAVLPLFVYGQLACILGYIKYRWQVVRPSRSVWLGAAAFFLAYACFVLKPSWYLATLLTTGPVWVGLWGASFPRVARFLTPVLGVIAAILFLSLPGRFLLIKDGASVTLLPDALFCVHAPLIAESLDARLAALPAGDTERLRLATFLAVLKTEIAQAQRTEHVYERLGLDADYLMHSSALSEAIFACAGNERKNFRDFCYASLVQGVRHNPGAYFQKVWIQFDRFLRPDANTFFRDRFDLAKLYRASAACWTAAGAVPLSADIRAKYEQFRRDTDREAVSAGLLGKNRSMRRFREGVVASVQAIEILFLICLVASFVWPPWRGLRAAGFASVTLFSAPLGNAFGVCLVHALDIDRYRATYGGYWVFALSSMALYLACCWLKIRQGFGASSGTRVEESGEGNAGKPRRLAGLADQSFN